MQTTRTKLSDLSISSVVRNAAPLLALLLLGTVSYGDGGRHHGDHGHRTQYIPPGLQVPAGNNLVFRASGVGVQIYVWTINPTNAALSSWVFKAPHAVLFGCDHEDEDVVGAHFAGPTWESNSGSKVAGVRLASVIVHSNAIPWLLLQGTNNAGAGVFADVTYIQRLNTIGGLAPSTPGTNASQEALVPYIADYYFYHTNH